jgi:uncharacterized repeat protein (TIGR03803 family)
MGHVETGGAATAQIYLIMLIRKEDRTMDTIRTFAVWVSRIYFRIALGALSTLSLFGAIHTVRAQNTPAERVIYSFRPATGYYPTGVVRDPTGNLYAATQLGGSDANCAKGCGNILKLSSSGRATVLYTFRPAARTAGPLPIGPLTIDANGVLYGATEIAGQNNLGTVFRVNPSGEEGILHSFDGGNDGSYPSGGVIMDSAGNLYGTTGDGGGIGCDGSGCGTVYKVTPSGGETVLYSFTGSTDGAYPSGSLLLDSTGNLYGTSQSAGNFNCFLFPGEGCGTVWKLDTSGNLTVLYSFTGGADGSSPSAGLVMDSTGDVYGDAYLGGNLSCNAPYGCGVVFEIDCSDNYTVLHTFAGGSMDGQNPDASLLRDVAGNLYGTTVYAGDLSCSQGGGFGCGVVFKLDGAGNETILHSLSGGTTDGSFPEGALISDGEGNLYGATASGGVANGGVVFGIRAQ